MNAVFEKFWSRHPALLYGLAALLGFYAAISWKTARGGKLHLTWEERATLAQTPARRNSGFGMQLIDKGIRHNLGGDTKVEFRAHGLYVELNVPLEPGKESRPAPQKAAALSA